MSVIFQARARKVDKMAASVNGKLTENGSKHTDDRLLLQTALRNRSNKPIYYKGQDVSNKYIINMVFYSGTRGGEVA